MYIYPRGLRPVRRPQVEVWEGEGVEKGEEGVGGELGVVRGSRPLRPAQYLGPSAFQGLLRPFCPIDAWGSRYSRVWGRHWRAGYMAFSRAYWALMGAFECS